MTSEIRTVVANGVEFGYLAEGHGPLALCLHGFPDTAYSYRHLLPELASAGYRAVAPFMRGYAPTAVPDDATYQTGALATDACALHEALGGDGDAVLIGHDWGAMATYGAVALEPGRWRRAVTMAVPPSGALMAGFLTYEQLKRSFYMFVFQTPLAEMVVPADDMAFIERLWGDWSPGYDAAEDVAYVKAALGEPANLGAALGYYRAMFGATPPNPAYERAQAATGEIADVPVLYLHGRDDGCMDAALAENAEAHLAPGSRREIVPDAGHFLHLERAKAVNRMIVDWVAR